MNVVIIGAGNVATVLGRKIRQGGHKVLQVVSRSLEHATILASTVQASASSNLREVIQGADIYIIAVSDTAVQNVAAELKVSNKIVVHTAGAVSRNILDSTSMNNGVLYPVQSLRKDLLYLPEIPIVIDASSDEVKDVLHQFAATWAGSIMYCNDEERLKLHVAAVFVSNFTNHLYVLAKGFSESEGLDFKFLLPLVEEVAKRIQFVDPVFAQTGPAARGDLQTIEKHKKVLANYPQLQHIYSTLTDSILNYHS